MSLSRILAINFFVKEPYNVARKKPAIIVLNIGDDIF